MVQRYPSELVLTRGQGHYLALRQRTIWLQAIQVIDRLPTNNDILEMQTLDFVHNAHADTSGLAAVSASFPAALAVTASSTLLSEGGGSPLLCITPFILTMFFL